MRPPCATVGVVWILLAAWLAAGAGLHAASGREAAAAALFAGPVPTFEITVAPDDADRLRHEPRSYVPAEVRVDGVRYTRVGIHLKGAAGSFRDFDDRPALTLNFDKFVKGQRCSGLEKLHLNNSAQDDSLTSEFLASRLHREAGVPTALSGHARVRLNGRDLGVYVLKEGYDAFFLRRQFPSGNPAPGNLYDGGFLQDVDARLERDTGKGPADHSDLRALRRAATTPVAKRGASLEQVLDVDRFLTCLAIQALTDDWDGYGRNRNNYRIYFDPVSGRAVFIPHGMDQLFADPGAPVNPDWQGLIARRVLEVPEFRDRYGRKLTNLLERQFTWQWMSNHLALVEAQLLPVLAGNSSEQHPSWSREFRKQSNRIAARIRNVRRQLGLPPDAALAAMQSAPMPPEPLTGWHPRPQQGAAILDERTEDGRRTLHLEARRRGTVASYRTSQVLPPGEYVLEGLARTKSLTVAPGMPGRGAGLRISGADRQQSLSGDTDWTPLHYEFELEDDAEVEFVLEIRADRGEAWFDLDALRLRRR
ncbi:MAG: CotH kinase family protein [Verrucomicrobiae bacterium]|nr:CotH kinase family protein [Verrucomicrobiae bacterium]